MEQKISDYDDFFEVDATEEEMQEWNSRSNSIMIDDPREDFKDTKAIPIPYAFVTGGVNVAGVFYLKEKVEDSYTDGAFIGVVVGTYRLDRRRTETCASNGIIKVCLRVSFSDRTLYYRFCNRKWNGKWSCSGWRRVIKF
jgi:hypothetical protein